MSAGNRSSGGSTETSETTSSSPATPYGMMNGELRGPTPVSRQNSGDGTVLLRVKAGEVSPSTTAMYSANMQNAFIVSVAPDVNYATLYQKVLKKIRLGRPVSSGEIIQLKWIDSDDDEVSLRCDADIEAMFGEAKDSGMGHVNIIAK
jgi:cell division control protein 24